MTETVPVLRFGTDGVRGVALEELTESAVAALGRAAAEVLDGGTTFVVARDTRESGPTLEAALARGLTDVGARVESLGVLPTAALAFTAERRGVPGAMISASHNPFHDNGIKFFSADGRKLSDDVEAQIEARLADDGTPASDATPDVVDSAAPARSAYLDHLASVVEGRSFDGLTIVVDCAHGAAFETGPEILRRLGATVEVVGAAPDGRNINDGCGSTHPATLRDAVTRSGADLGVALDGDADRLIAVDDRGEVVDGDHLLAISALDMRDRGVLERDTVVATVMANLGFKQAMAAHDIAVVETKVGDRYVLEAMLAGGFSLGGEQSGHLIYRDHATTGDGLLSAVMLLDVLARSGGTLSELASVVTKLPQVLENVRVADRDALHGADAFWDEVRRVEADLGDSGRVLVRPSGTEPLVRVMVEAATEDEAARCSGHLAGILADTLGPSE